MEGLNDHEWTSLIKKNNLNIESISINQFAVNIDKYCEHILLVPDTICEVINSYLQSVSNPFNQDIIILSTSNNKGNTHLDFESLNIVDCINLKSDHYNIVNTLKNHLKNEKKF